MKRFGFLAAVLFAVASLFAEEGTSERVDFTSVPDGATVTIDGETRGVTPLQVFDLTPGEHRVRFDKNAYEGADDFFTLAEGSYQTRHVELTPVKGLLLLTTEPEGCDISLDGLSLGESPRLITDLDVKDVHRLLLQKAGYQPRTIEVKFVGRTPLVRHEKLILDSGVLEIKTDPAGASVTVNGIARGQTPVTVRGIPKGQTTVEFVKHGFKETAREVTLNPGDSQTLYVKLEGLPGAMKLTSVPEGARFYVNDLPEGKSPVVKNMLNPGSYVVRCELEGFDTITRTIEIGNGAVVNEEFRLENVLGSIEIKTNPVGAQVLVDGHVAGTTKSGDPAAELSDVLIIPGLVAGEHTVIVRKDSYTESVKHPTVVNQQATKLSVKLRRIFKPNIEIETETGTYRGVLVDQSASAIIIETQPGVPRPFPRSSIRTITPLD